MDGRALLFLCDLDGLLTRRLCRSDSSVVHSFGHLLYCCVYRRADDVDAIGDNGVMCSAAYVPCIVRCFVESRVADGVGRAGHSRSTVVSIHIPRSGTH